jgi:DNA-binding transcriptional ArsR family regulator
MPTYDHKTLVLTARQIAVLVSPVRVELLQHLATAGPCSVAALATALARTPHALYYHLRCLTRAGLVRTRIAKRAGHRPEAIYERTAGRIGLPYDPRTPGNTAVINRAATAVLRRAERTFHHAMRRGWVAQPGSTGDALVSARTVWLTDEALGRLRESWARLEEAFVAANSRREGRPFRVTIALAPLAARTESRAQASPAHHPRRRRC